MTEFLDVAHAIKNESMDSVAELVSQDSGVLYQSNVFWGTLLHYAITNGKRNAAHWLIRQGADIHVRAGAFDQTPLECAVAESMNDVVRKLIDNGAAPDLSRIDRNILFSTVEKRNVELARFLISKEVSPHQVYRSSNGMLRNALSYALDRGATEIAELLRSAGCTLPVEQVPPVKWVAPDPKHEPIRKHLKEILGPIEPLCLREAEPAETHIQTTCPPLEVAIHVVRPTADQPYLTLFTTGMSDHSFHTAEELEEYRFAELILRLPPTFELCTDHTDLARFWPLYWLRRLAYYPHHARTCYDGPWFTLEPSEPPAPIAPGVPQTGFLFVADYPPCTPLTCDDGKLVRFYSVMTAYPEECSLAFRRGTFRLVERFARKSLRLIADPARPNTF